MDTPTIPNPQANYHATDFLRALLTLSNRAAFNGVKLVHTDDYPHPPARIIAEAIHAAARHALDAGHPTARISASDVNAQLLHSGHLTNNSVLGYWLEIVAPSNGAMPPQGYHLKTLAARIAEDHFRTMFAEAYGRPDAHVVPLEEITEHMARTREQLLKVYARVRPALTSVKEGEAA